MPQRRIHRPNGDLRIAGRQRRDSPDGLDRASSWEIRKAAVKIGMRTLRMDAWDKVIAGQHQRRRSASCDQGRGSVACRRSPTPLATCRANRSPVRLKPPANAKSPRSCPNGRCFRSTSRTSARRARRLFGRRKKVKGQTMAIFYSQMASLLRAGVPMIRSLNVLSEQSSDPVLKEVDWRNSQPRRRR